jgi:hypothetical protein
MNDFDTIYNLFHIYIYKTFIKKVLLQLIFDSNYIRIVTIEYNI